jgi:hypothetical protein
MTDKGKPKWRTTAKTHPRRITLYEDEVGVCLLHGIARRRNCTVATAMRQLVREEAERLGLNPAVAGPAPPTPSALTPEERAIRSASVMGKYAWVPTNSEEFSRRKREEIAREDRRP